MSINNGRFRFDRLSPPEIPPGGLDWSEFTSGVYLSGLADVIAVSPQDGQALLWNSATSRWELSDVGSGGSGTVVPISVDIDFSASSSEDVIIPIAQENVTLLRGRLYIDTDPGSAFDEWLTYTFYSAATKTGTEAYYRVASKASYTELEVGTTGSDAYVIPDDHTVFDENDLGYIIDDASSEFFRAHTVADTIVAEDVIGVHAIDTGLSRVSECSGFHLYNDESGTNTYFRVEFDTPQTVSMKMDMVVVT